MPDRVILTLLLAGILATCAGCTLTFGDLSPGQDASATDCGFTTHGLVTRVIDGDTFSVRYPDGSDDTVRILGIDTPETDDAGNSKAVFSGISNPTYLTSWGKRASSFSRDILLGEEVTLYGDCQAGSRDKYGRLLAYVTSRGTDTGSLLIREGYARVYTGEDFSRKQEYLALQQEAQERGAGLWNPAGVAGETMNGPVRIAYVQYDAPGDDRENLNGEYVSLVAEERTDLSGWTLGEGDGTLYHFPSLTLEAGDSLVIHTGSGVPGGCDLYWNQTSPLLGNSADSVVLKDPTGKTVSSYSWG
jgi:micrococcal nuclease